MAKKSIRSASELTKSNELAGKEFDSQAIEEAISKLLLAAGENPKREGLLQTPERVAAMYRELLAGYRNDPSAIINNAIFSAANDDMVIVRDIEFFSLCEHHMLPFMGHVHVAYVPNEKIIGLSKIPRIVDLFSARLQVQENLTRQIAEFVNKSLHPQGVAVVMEAKHLCSMMRGVRKHDARMTTSTMLGIFRKDEATRLEFLSGISRAGQGRNF